MTFQPLGYADVLAAAVLLALNGALSLHLGLGLERRLAIAALRMVAQLALVGVVLKLVFDAGSPLLTLAVALAMTAFAAWEIRARLTTPIMGPWLPGLGGGALLAIGLATTTYLSTLVIGAAPWWRPSVFLPVLGMILGNALTAMALALETLTQRVATERPAIEARIALGAGRLEALDVQMRAAAATASLPIVNAMAVAGVVSLPGMMTGQVLAGIDPVEAAKYQLAIMFAIAGATALAVAAATIGAALLVTDGRGRLRLDRLRRQTDAGSTQKVPA